MARCLALHCSQPEWLRSSLKILLDILPAVFFVHWRVPSQLVLKPFFFFKPGIALYAALLGITSWVLVVPGKCWCKGATGPQGAGSGGPALPSGLQGPSQCVGLHSQDRQDRKSPVSPPRAAAAIPTAPSGALGSCLILRVPSRPHALCGWTCSLGFKPIPVPPTQPGALLCPDGAVWGTPLPVPMVWGWAPQRWRLAHLSRDLPYTCCSPRTNPPNI